MGNPMGLEIMLINNMVIILGKVVLKEIINHSNRVRWNFPLDAPYVHFRVTSILYIIDLYTTIWANKFPL